MGKVCGVRWCLAEAGAESECCPVHTKLPALAGETIDQWMRRAPIRARHNVVAASVLASIRGGKATTAEIANDIDHTPSAVRLALKMLRGRGEVERHGCGRAIRYKAAMKAA